MNNLTLTTLVHRPPPQPGQAPSQTTKQHRPYISEQFNEQSKARGYEKCIALANRSYTIVDTIINQMNKMANSAFETTTNTIANTIDTVLSPILGDEKDQKPEMTENNSADEMVDCNSTEEMIDTTKWMADRLAAGANFCVTNAVRNTASILFQVTDQPGLTAMKAGGMLSLCLCDPCSALTYAYEWDGGSICQNVRDYFLRPKGSHPYSGLTRTGCDSNKDEFCENFFRVKMHTVINGKLFDREVYVDKSLVKNAEKYLFDVPWKALDSDVKNEITARLLEEKGNKASELLNAETDITASSTLFHRGPVRRVRFNSEGEIDFSNCEWANTNAGSLQSPIESSIRTRVTEHNAKPDRADEKYSHKYDVDCTDTTHGATCQIMDHKGNVVGELTIPGKIAKTTRLNSPNIDEYYHSNRATVISKLEQDEKGADDRGPLHGENYCNNYLFTARQKAPSGARPTPNIPDHKTSKTSSPTTEPLIIRLTHAPLTPLHDTRAKTLLPSANNGTARLHQD